MFFDSIRQKINIRYFMTAYLALFLIFSSLMTGHPIYILRGFLIVLFYSIFDLLSNYLRYKSWILPLSSWISALILSLVAWQDLPWIFIFLFPLLAVFSKQLLHFGKARHIFNPAGFALTVSSFFVPAVAWWGASWGTLPMIIVSVIGIFILWRQSRWDEFIAFALAYIFFLIALSVSSGIMDPAQLLAIIKTRTLQGSIIFFASIMLIEPITSQFPLKKQRIIYGTLVGFFAVLITFLISRWTQFQADPLILGLLLGNLTASLFFIPNAHAKNQ